MSRVRVGAKHLNVLVVGAGSSQLPGSSGAGNAYPARLQRALADRLRGVDVKVTTDVKSGRTAAEMVKTLPAALGCRQAGASGLADRDRGRDARRSIRICSVSRAGQGH